ncbi:uncharacterized protein LOC121772732 [Salvia splendens]|uniref:uncharacterized protein LOC121772732 n=1 Tax=Salvia splendens TaxID=180675 RepID=UPI001C263959|nr:uncharacterized protein LOC121772732 [Salvia splendens]
MYLDDAYSIWSDLKDRFSLGDSARLYQLRQQLMNLSLGSADVNTYFTNLRIRHIDGSHFSNSGSHLSNSALLAVHPSAPSEQPFTIAATSYGRGLNKFLCSHCGKKNHPVEKCFFKHGFPPGYGKGIGKPFYASSSSSNQNSNQGRSVNCVEDNSSASPALMPSEVNLPTKDQYQQLVALLQSQLHTSAPAITHKSYSEAQPSNFSAAPIQNASVNLPNGNTAHVSHLGNVLLTPLITLSSVLLVPTFSFNLISVSALTKHSSCIVIFTHNGFQIKEALTGTVIGRGNRVGNLYIFEFPGSSSSEINKTQSQDVIQAPWPSGKGHLDTASILEVTSSTPRRRILGINFLLGVTVY